MGALNELLVGTTEHAFATALYATLDGSRLTWCNAGHPAPVIARAAGDTALLGERTGPLLGLAGSSYGERSVELDADDTLVLYTDGLVEHRSWTLDDGLAHLLAEVARHRELPVEGLCASLVRSGRGGR